MLPSPNPADLVTNDTQSAQDNFLFLTAWFAAYPEYAANDFYLSGVSAQTLLLCYFAMMLCHHEPVVAPVGVFVRVCLGCSCFSLCCCV